MSMDRTVEQQQIRSNILEIFRDNDRAAWERYCIAKLFRRHAASVAMEVAFEKHMKELVEAVEAEQDAEELQRLAQITYFLALINAGIPSRDATLMSCGLTYNPYMAAYGF